MYWALISALSKDADEEMHTGRHNISNELARLLQQLSVNDLLDFALGSGGRWYIRYRQKGSERQGEPTITLATQDNS